MRHVALAYPVSCQHSPSPGNMISCLAYSREIQSKACQLGNSRGTQQQVALLDITMPHCFHTQFAYDLHLFNPGEVGMEASITSRGAQGRTMLLQVPWAPYGLHGTCSSWTTVSALRFTCTRHCKVDHVVLQTVLGDEVPRTSKPARYLQACCFVRILDE